MQTRRVGVIHAAVGEVHERRAAGGLGLAGLLAGHAQRVAHGEDRDTEDQHEPAAGDLQPAIVEAVHGAAAAQQVRSLMFIERFSSEVDARIDQLGQ